MRAIYYYGFSEADTQSQIPVIHPVVDYSYVFGQPVLGGELSYQANFTSLSRGNADFDPISATAFANGLCALDTADPAAQHSRQLPAARRPGQLHRASGEVQWRRSITDPYRPDLDAVRDAARGRCGRFRSATRPASPTTSTPGDSTEFRAMPTVGLEYRYPFISVQSWGTQTIEPIAQVIVRPNEPRIGKLPNEDSQSLIFDDTNLFKIDKFSGWDRIEGGGRANVGVQYTTQFNRGGIDQRACSASRISCSAPTRSRPATSPTPASAAASTPTGPTTWRACPTQPDRIYTLHHPLPLRQGRLRGPSVRGRRPRQFRPLVQFACCTAITTPSRSSAS